MNIKLFERIDYDSDEMITTYFDIMYSDNRLLEAIGYLIKKIGFSTDGAYCHFPDMNSYDEEDHFEGVQFIVGYPPTDEDTMTVSEEICYHYVRLACEKYLEFHPEDTTKVNELLAKMPI
ncbi:ribonuclease toxin immunity protein CdiI [Photorhabdus antumapuensis]|uniref:ribonuclease toxin immunity protein CdiI n=1 Tax=Photorhabdus antumapuensis TaxID=2862867 RepID=UPI001CEC3EB3|nr:ribonuclease toxin immunity protein CdiI [Photorhabdus antumapuensis]MCA6222963.1 ribonuclease toxin immunity protein CdiI [Photorhabdus antumapuensis]